jgi:hypothetical protein
LTAAATAATDGGLSFVLKKWYRSAGYWGGPARTSADRRAFAAVATGGRPRTSGFGDVDDFLQISFLDFHLKNEVERCITINHSSNRFLFDA